MKLFVGLGNPGTRYAANRHNVGFMTLDRIALEHGIANWRKRFQGESADGLINGEKVILLKPATYMNDSGRAVGAAVRFLKLDLADVVVFYDEIDLAAGKLKVKTGGGNAGHNGLRSITHLVGNDYVRVRIGVGHPGHKDLVADYVLHNFTADERDEWVDPMLDAIAKASQYLAAGDSARFLSEVHMILNPDQARAGKAATIVARRDKNKNLASNIKADKTQPVSGPRTGSSHPAGERRAKQKGALAEKLQKWLKGREKK